MNSAAKKPNSYKRKSLACPVCGFKRLIDAGEHNDSELRPENTSPPDWVPDYIQKCPQCKSQIGIKKMA